MFTGIIEDVGEVVNLEKNKSNLRITVESALSRKLKIDQSVCHNGVCLTVVDVRKSKNTHTVEAVSETLKRTNLGHLRVGSRLNLERAMKASGRFDGHIVQGHIDQRGRCVKIENKNGSVKCWFSFVPGPDFLMVEKGSVCIDGVSLTVVDSLRDRFSVVIIPYTFDHTCFRLMRKGTEVNLEFDILGKYVSRSLKAGK